MMYSNNNLKTVTLFGVSKKKSFYFVSIINVKRMGDTWFSSHPQSNKPKQNNSVVLKTAH